MPAPVLSMNVAERNDAAVASSLRRSLYVGLELIALFDVFAENESYPLYHTTKGGARFDVGGCGVTAWKRKRSL